MEQIQELLFGPARYHDVVLAIGIVGLVVVLIVALVLAVAMQPKPPQPAPASLEEFDFPVAEDGKDVAVIFGDCWTEDPNVLWYGDLSTRPIKSKSK